MVVAISVPAADLISALEPQVKLLVVPTIITPDPLSGGQAFQDRGYCNDGKHPGRAKPADRSLSTFFKKKEKHTCDNTLSCGGRGMAKIN